MKNNNFPLSCIMCNDGDANLKIILNSFSVYSFNRWGFFRWLRGLEIEWPPLATRCVKDSRDDGPHTWDIREAACLPSSCSKRDSMTVLSLWFAASITQCIVDNLVWRIRNCHFNDIYCRAKRSSFLHQKPLGNVWQQT